LSVPEKSNARGAALALASREKSPAVKHSIELNKHKQGVVLPIFTDSSDTVRFTIYRAVAAGAGNFGPPEVLSNLPTKPGD
jgi:hypothetical protein